MAISESAQIMAGAVYVVPGILGLKPDDHAYGPAPLRLVYGPVCDRCWMADGAVIAASYCPHRSLR